MGGITQFVERLYMSPRLSWLKNLFGIHKLYPDGHFHSAIPTAPEFKPVKAAEHYRGIVLNDTVQISFLEALSEHYKDLPQHWLQKLEGHYSYDNAFFSYSDAILLFCVIAHHRAMRIIELGTGYSSLCILDSLEALKLNTEFQTYDLNDFSEGLQLNQTECSLIFINKTSETFPWSYFRNWKAGIFSLWTVPMFLNMLPMSIIYFLVFYHN
jgi:hypothetical protein